MGTLRIIAITLLLVSLAITPAFAMRHGMKGGYGHGGGENDRIEHLAVALDLTPEQEDAIEKIISDSREATRALHAATRAGHRDVRDLMKADTFDQDKLRTLVLVQADRQISLMVARHEMRAKIDQILTPEQLEKHEGMRQHRREHRMLRFGARGEGYTGSDF